MFVITTHAHQCLYINTYIFKSVDQYRADTRAFMKFVIIKDGY